MQKKMIKKATSKKKTGEKQNKTLFTIGKESEQKKTGQLILEWGKVHGRKGLPWQVKDPYAVWISEIMLQQTQVETVKEYYNKFMKLWPTVNDLASASEDDVLAAWAGLGYYGRAKRLHRAAQIVVKDWQGQMPQKAKDLETLPGIGRSTASAISSICFNEQVPILDGNVSRVVARRWGVEAPINQSQTIKALWLCVEKMVPKEAGLYTQSIMDLGATVCTPKKPLCEQCPLSQQCVALQKNKVTLCPVKEKSKSQRRKETESWKVLTDGERVALVKNEKKEGVWQSLWVFPEVITAGAEEDLTMLKQWELNHSFSHYDLQVNVSCWRVNKDVLEYGLDEQGWTLAPLDQVLEWALPKPVKEVIQEIQAQLKKK